MDNGIMNYIDLLGGREGKILWFPERKYEMMVARQIPINPIGVGIGDATEVCNTEMSGSDNYFRRYRLLRCYPVIKGGLYEPDKEE